LDVDELVEEVRELWFKCAVMGEVPASNHNHKMRSLNGEGQEEGGVHSYHQTPGVSLMMKNQLVIPLQQIIHPGLDLPGSTLMVLHYEHLMTDLPHFFLHVDGSTFVTETVNEVVHCMIGKGMSLVRSIVCVILGQLTGIGYHLLSQEGLLELIGHEVRKISSMDFRTTCLSKNLFFLYLL
jgi:hypothetical protein